MRVKKCTVCEKAEVLEAEVISALGHDSGSWVVETEASENNEGLRVRKCTRCGSELERQTIDRVYVNKFDDVEQGKWYAQAVEFVVTRGLFNGTSETSFSPNGEMQRAMMVTVLARLDGADIDNYQLTPFSDVKVGKYYTGAVVWAAQNGIVDGVSDRRFAPMDNITREQCAAILYRYAQYKNHDVSAQADITGYTDAKMVHSYALKPVSWACGVGIINGVSSTSLAPRNSCTRAQVAKMLMMFCNIYEQ